ncbi:hypothetical protein LUZ60_012516 [Juncus effusus]|nr:hypothetical protein LUZ60_012516 [Juncus effusus]
MASGPGDGTVQGQRYNENKVYTRKFHGKNAKPPPTNPNPPQPDPIPPPAQVEPVQLTDDVSSIHLEPPAPAEPVADPAQPVRVSDDESSSLKRGGGGAHSEGPNGVSKSVTLNISTKSRQELREVRRRLTSELEQVRALSKRLEVAASAAAATSVATPVAAPEAGYTQSQFSATDPETPVTLQQPVFSKRTPDVDVIATTNSVAVPVATPATIPPPKAPVTVSIPVPYRRQLCVSLSATDFPTESLEKRTPKANQLYNNADFLLAKDRIPPETFKKSKSNGSKKHSLSSELDHNEKKIYSNAFKKCSGLHSKLMKHKFGWVFNKPVDPAALQLHDYFTIIKHPMDLGTIKTRLSKNWYKSPREYAEDVRLTFQNAMTYNPKGQDVHVMAEQLAQIFEEGWSAIEAEMTYQLSYHSTPKPVPPKKTALSVPDPRTLERSDSTAHPKSIPVPVPVSIPAPYIGRTPALKKPKAKDMNKRDMTFEEKRRLSNNLQNLPQEKLDVVVQIIKRKNLTMSQHDDEIEVDIDSMDVETLWELDRFVTNYKKNLSKHKRKAELAMLARRGVDQNTPRAVQDIRAQENNAGGEAPNRGDEGYVATSGGPEQEGQKGENGSRSSSSSSSSSSGSSSSDSDSDSSSAYGSDAPQ